MKKILEDIKTNTYERFYLFYGEEKYMISQMKNQLKKALVSEDDTMNYSYFEGKRADAIEIIELAKTLPFFSDHRFLILDETGLGKKSDDTFIEGLKEASDTSVVLFIEDSVDKRSKIYKFLSKEGHAVCFESAGDKELSRWLISLLKKEGKQMSSATMRSFLYRCGSDMYTLKNELEKLISYVGEREEITIRDLEELTSSQTTNQIFVMLEAIARKSNGMIAKQMKVPAFVAGKLKDQAKMFSMDTLRDMIEACAKTDESIKTGKISDRVGVELLLIQFSQK